MSTVTDTNNDPNEDTDDDTKRADQLDQQYKMADAAITGLSEAITQAKTTIAEKETELSQAEPSQVSGLQTELRQLKTQLAQDEEAFDTVMTAKARTKEGKVIKEPRFEDILRVS